MTGAHLPLLKRVLRKSGKPVDQQEERDENSKENDECIPSFEKKVFGWFKSIWCQAVENFAFKIIVKGQLKK